MKIRLFLCFTFFILVETVFCEESKLALLLSSSFTKSSEGAKAQLELEKEQLKNDAAKAETFPQLKIDSPGLFGWSQIEDIQSLSMGVGLGLQQNLPHGGQLELSISQTVEKVQGEEMYRITPTFQSSFTQPLVGSLLALAEDPKTVLTDLQWMVARLQFVKSKNEILLKNLQLIRDLDVAMNEMEVLKLEEEALKAKSAQTQQLADQGRVSKVDVWKIDGELRLTKRKRFQAQIDIENLRDDWKRVFQSVPFAIEDNERVLFFSRFASVRNSSVSLEKQILVLEGRLVELDCKQNEVSQAPILTAGFTAQPDPDNHPFFPGWKTSWESLTRSTPWSLSFQLGFKYSSGFTGKSEEEAKVRQLKIAEKAKELEELENKLDRSFELQLKRIEYLEEDLRQLGEALDQDKHETVDLEDLLANGQVTDVDYKDTRVTSKSLQNESLRTQWELCLTKLQLFAARGIDLEQVFNTCVSKSW